MYIILPLVSGGKYFITHYIQMVYNCFIGSDFFWHDYCNSKWRQYTPRHPLMKGQWREALITKGD